MSAESLKAAEAEVAGREKAGTCTRPTLAAHPQAVMGLGELNAEQARQHQEADETAA